MQYNIFLASSIVELAHDRDAVGNFVRKMNDALRDVEGDHYLHLFICELEDAAMSPEGKQMQYNRHLQNCHLFVNLYFNKAGEFTLQELEAAKQARQNKAVPELLILFRVKDCDGILWQPDGSIPALKDRLQAEGLPYLAYEDVDHVKLELLKWLQRANQNLPISIDGRVGRIGSRVVIR